MRCILRAAAVPAVVLLTVAAPAQAQVEDHPTTLTIRSSVKTSAFWYRSPSTSERVAERTGMQSLSRFRIEPTIRTGETAIFTFAYEQRLRYASSPGGVALAAILPSESAAPFRVRALDWSIGAGSTSWRHEIDRASAQWHRGRADITVGRQAIGWGRGVLFGAVDLFAPFSPLEADREWRRGVDAIRADVKVTDRSSVDLVAAFGRRIDDSAFAVRARGFAGPLDVEVVGGRRARDAFAGTTASAAVGDAEVHGELAAFRVDAPMPASDSRVVWKAVAGGSYRLPVGSGILFYAEYHYSGFGARRPEDIVPLLSTPAFAARYVRGDTQILSRHAFAATAMYEASTEFTWSGQWIHNPGDRSGVIAPGLTYTASDRLSFLGTAYIPYGATPEGSTLRSEFGAASRSALLQLRLYF